MLEARRSSSKVSIISTASLSSKEPNESPKKSRLLKLLRTFSNRFNKTSRRRNANASRAKSLFSPYSRKHAASLADKQPFDNKQIILTRKCLSI